MRWKSFSRENKMKLDFSLVLSVKEAILEAIDECGYSPEEAIPGLVQAIIKLADGDDRVLLHVGDLIADGGIDETEGIEE
jgi:hypothetical protein